MPVDSINSYDLDYSEPSFPRKRPPGTRMVDKVCSLAMADAPSVTYT